MVELSQSHFFVSLLSESISDSLMLCFGAILYSYFSQ